MKKITVLKIGAKWCPPCVALAKAKTLEKFVDKHPDVRLEVHDDSMAGNAPAWEKFSDGWGVKAIPVLIWTLDGEELLRSSNVSASDIEKQYERAVRKAGL